MEDRAWLTTRNNGPGSRVIQGGHGPRARAAVGRRGPPPAGPARGLAARPARRLLRHPCGRGVDDARCRGGRSGDLAGRLRRGCAGARADAHGRGGADGSAGAGALPRAGGFGCRRRGGCLRASCGPPEHPLLAVRAGHLAAGPRAQRGPVGRAARRGAPPLLRPRGCRHRPGGGHGRKRRGAGTCSWVPKRRSSTGSSTRCPGPMPPCGACPDRGRRRWDSGRCADDGGPQDRPGPACLRCGNDHDRAPSATACSRANGTTS